jgi:hypothetical protein
MHIGSGARQWQIPFDPPLSAWTEARERLIQMDRDAAQSLDRSDITVKEYRAPKGFHAVVFAGCLIGYWAFSMRSNWEPGSILHDRVFWFKPTLAEFIGKHHLLALAIMLALHVFEATTMARIKLRRHSVSAFGLLWWTWVLSTFIEGLGAFQRYPVLTAKRLQLD